MSKVIDQEFLEECSRKFDGDRANRVAMNAVMHTGVMKAAKNDTAVRNDTYSFSVNIEQGDITNQKKSGRCWMFAAMNCMRFRVMKKLNLKTFELSQSYTLFYDKLEKANYFLENILHTLDEKTGSRLLSHLLADPVQDGGQWDMIANIMRKYGVVPKEAMPETECSSATSEMDAAITLKLSEFACMLRTQASKGADMESLENEKKKMMGTVYNMLVICLGKPPVKFNFEVRDKDGKFIRDNGITPVEFFKKYVDINLDDYISVINAPTADKPYHRSYTVRMLGNVAEGRIVRYVNLPADELKDAAIRQLKDNEPVWFGCDVGKDSDSESGVMDTDIHCTEELFGTDFKMTKAERLDYGRSMMTHAMTLQGVNIGEDGKPDRWRVENSWGKDPGKDGYFVMSDDWFTEYTYQVVVNKKYLSEKVIREYSEEPIVLEPWDPMGSLA